MGTEKEILHRIADTVKSVYPDADLILYGSRARGDHSPDSDYDLLVLLNQDYVSRTDQTKVSYPLYDIEFDSGHIISPLVLSKKEWETKHRISPFYERVMEEGIRL